MARRKPFPGAIVIDGAVTELGECDNCELMGVLRRRPFIPPMNYSDPADTIEASELHILRLCVTCFDTPAGCESENLRTEKQ